MNHPLIFGPLQSLFAAGSDSAARRSRTWAPPRRSRTRAAAKSTDARSAAATGKAAEGLAERFLRRERGFSVVARNWRCPRDRRLEIDLVCRDRGALVFVEVKLRPADALVPGYFAVGLRKRRALARAIRSYLEAMRPPPRTFRLDVVEVAAAAGDPIIRHFQNIPLFSKYYRP